MVADKRLERWGPNMRSNPFTLLCCLILCALPLRGQDIAPVVAWNVNTEQLSKEDITIRRGETVNLQPTYLNYGDPIDLTPALLVVFRYRPISAPSSAYYVITGQVAVATGGVVNVRWTSAAEISNSACIYELSVQSPDAMLVRSYGNLTLQPGLADSGATSAAPAVVTYIDWSTVDSANISSAPFMSTFNLIPIQNQINTLFYGTGAASVYSISSVLPYIGSAVSLSNFPSYLARTSNVPANAITNVYAGDDEVVASVVQVDQHNVVIHFPIVSEGEIATTNKLYWLVNSGNVGYVSSNGITLLQGSLQLLQSDLNCNVRAYDGNVRSPSMTFFNNPLSGWYNMSINGSYDWAYAHGSNAVAVICPQGWILYGTATYNGYGAELGYCDVSTGYQVNGVPGRTTNLTVITSILTNSSGSVTGKVSVTLNFVGGILQ